MVTEVRLLGPGEEAVLGHVAEGVFDNPVHPRWSAEFLADPRHHLAVALVEGVVVGMASAVHYLHPDKPPELWINEVGVASLHQGQGLGKALLKALFAHGRTLGCHEAWVLTEVENVVARGLYASVGGAEAPQRPVYAMFELESPA